MNKQTDDGGAAFKIMKMTVEIKPYGFELHDEKGAVVMESDPGNKGKLHRWLSNKGFKPSMKTADLWEKCTKSETFTPH